MTLKNHRSLPYFQKGEAPPLLVITGTHGDERGIIHSLKKHVKKITPTLPDFLFIPEISPTAVKQGTRHNQEGKDLNRHFYRNTPSEEAQAVMDFLLPHQFEISLSFHEDPDRTEACYFYDSHLFSNEDMFHWRKYTDFHNIPRFTGLDDPDDPNLCFEISDGYTSHFEKEGNYAGIFLDWSITSGITQRSFEIEIPGLATQKRKDFLTEALFDFFVEKFFGNTFANGIGQKSHKPLEN